MKVINSKLAAIGLAAFVFASCSDSNSDPGTSPAINPADLSSITLTSQSVDNSRVINYKNTTANARKFFLSSRAGEASFVTSMPTIPSESSYNKVLNLNGAGDLSEGKAYSISGNKTIDFSGKKIQGATIFVHGGCTMKYDQTLGGNTFVLLGSAKLEYTGSNTMVAASDKVYIEEANGTLAATGSMVINGELYANLKSKSDEANKDLVSGLGAIAEKTSTEKGKSITPTQDITFGEGAKAYINGSIRAQKLTIANNANVYTTSNVFDSKGITLNGNLKVDGFVQVGDFTNKDAERKAVPADMAVNGYLETGANSAVKVTGTLSANAGSKIVANYINVTNNPKNADGTQKTETVDGVTKTIAGDATLKLNGNCKIILGNKNVVNVNNLVTDNAAQGQIELKEDNAVAVIKADKFTNNGDEKILSFLTSGDNASLLFEFTENYQGTTKLSSFDDLAIQATYADYDKTGQNTLIQFKDENNKNYGYEWKGDASKLVEAKKLDLIASSEDPNDGESATCIQPANGKIYVSYHTNGNNVVGGNIEVASMDGTKKLVIESSKKAANIDYNHLIVDGNSLFLAGSEQGNRANGVKGVGAFLGQVKLNGTSLGDDLTLYAINKKVSNIDANCVAKYGSDYVLATTTGFSVFDKDFNYWNNDGNLGKHVVTANGHLYTLTENGTVTVYDNSDMENGTSYQVGEVAPKGTKAVVAVDESNGDIYVCKGENGVAKISNNNVNANFYTCPKNSSDNNKGNANGVAVDAQYVYIACGGYGLVVLDKATGNVVCHRQAANGKSANYVSVDANGYIYVAYGQSRIQVFKMTKTK